MSICRAQPFRGNERTLAVPNSSLFSLGFVSPKQLVSDVTFVKLRLGVSRYRMGNNESVIRRYFILREAID